MITLNSRELSVAGVGTTQAFHIGMLGTDIPTPGREYSVEAAKVILPTGELMRTAFTRTYSASVTSEYFFEIGTGKVESILYARLLLQHAKDVGTPFADIVESFTNFIQAIALDAEYWRALIAYTTGPTRRVLKASDVAHVTPTAILEFVRTRGGAEGNDIFYHFVTDFISGIFAKLGLLQPDSGYVFRSSRIDTFPRRGDLINVVRAMDLARILTSMADVDVAPMSKTFRERQAVLPMMIATELNNAASMAYERSRGSYDPTKVVDSILVTLARIWAPTMPEVLQPKQRVTASAPIQELRTNLAMFLAYQELRAGEAAPEVSYNDEEMTAIILPLFMESMAMVSPYKLRPLNDATQFLGQRSVRDFTTAPVSTIIYENWSFNDSVSAFTPIKHLSSGRAHFLKPEPTISERMSTSLSAIGQAMSVGAFVEQRSSTAELVPEARRVTVGTDITLAFPSLVARDIAMNVKPGFTSALLHTGYPDPDALEKDPSLGQHSRDILYNYHALITHYACSGQSSVSIGKIEGESAAPILYLVWDERTSLKIPLGSAAIYGGFVATTEPLEAVLYRADSTPAEALTARSPDLASYVKMLHIWDWFGDSSGLLFQTSYPTTISGRSYSVKVLEHEMLSLGAARERVRFIVPPIAKSLVSLWFSWLMEEYIFVNLSAKSKSDDLTSIGFEGRRMQIAMLLVNKLETIGAAPIGSTTTRLVVQRLIAKMVGSNELDEVSSLSRGVQQHRLRIWAGLATLQMMEMITPEDADALLAIIRDTGALSLVISQVEMD